MMIAETGHRTSHSRNGVAVGPAGRHHRGRRTITPFKNGNAFPTMLFAETEVDPWAVGRIEIASWPKADVIIGNPPFLDARKMTMEHGKLYVSHLERLYPGISRRADYCTYWIRRAHDHLPKCERSNPIAGRAGLVGTQNIRNNEAREGGLDYVVQTGTIVEAVENEPWSGEANVHVSIVNWMNTKDSRLAPGKRRLWRKVEPPPERNKIRKRGDGPASKEFELNVRECKFINSALSDEVDVSGAILLSCNRVPKRCFEGQQPDKGFRISQAERDKIIRGAPKAKDVLFPYMNGTSLLTHRFSENMEYLIDFGSRDILSASEFPALLDMIRIRVLPDWQSNARTEKTNTGKRTGEHQRRVDTWWLLKRPRGDLIKAVRSAKRYVACSRVMKRPIFVFLSSRWRPDSSLTAFTFNDDYSFGVLQSNVHWLWFAAFQARADFRYTPESSSIRFLAQSLRQTCSVSGSRGRMCDVRDTALSKTKGG
jgi:hypothetical protein